MARRKLLLVEGTDDLHVMRHICRNHGIPHLDEIRPHGGAGPLLEAIPVQLKSASDEGDVVGVVVDADQDISTRWRQLHRIFEAAGYPNVPRQPDPTGTILNSPIRSLLPRVGVWVMPDNRTDGILEDFLRFLIPQGDALLYHVIQSVASIPRRRFSPNDEPKAIIHTWLAWQEEPGRPYGTAITARFLDPESDEATVLASWIRRLFHPEGA